MVVIHNSKVRFTKGAAADLGGTGHKPTAHPISKGPA